jgi:uncharacterized protein
MIEGSMKDFLGRGLGFPLSVDGHGSLRMSSHEISVKESVSLVLGTPVGERMMAPDFGCKIHDLVFHPNDPNTAAMASLYVKTALRKWEPRIDDIDVRAVPDPSDSNVMRVEIAFRVRRTNSIENLVYPFFLRRDQDL